MQCRCIQRCAQASELEKWICNTLETLDLVRSNSWTWAVVRFSTFLSSSFLFSPTEDGGAKYQMFLGVEKWKCKTFNSQILLRVHEKQHLNGIETTECKVCHKKIQSRSFKIHSLTHTEKEPFECPFCQKCFNNGGSLVRHKKLHSTETPFPCNICATVYPSKSQLDRYVKVTLA